MAASWGRPSKALYRPIIFSPQDYGLGQEHFAEAVQLLARIIPTHRQLVKALREAASLPVWVILKLPEAIRLRVMETSLAPSLLKHLQ